MRTYGISEFQFPTTKSALLSLTILHCWYSSVWQNFIRTFNVTLCFHNYKISLIFIPRMGNKHIILYLSRKGATNDEIKLIKLCNQTKPDQNIFLCTKGYSPRYLFCTFFLDCWFKRKRYPSTAEKRIEKKSSAKNIKYSSTFHNVFIVY